MHLLILLKMELMRLVITLLFLHLFIGWTEASETEFFFNRMSPPDGLTSESVNAIAQDAHDFIWIGTNHGLLKYTPQNRTPFTNVSTTHASLRHGIIKALSTDGDGVLWVGTNQNLSILDCATQHFLPQTYTDEQGAVQSPDIHCLDSDLNGHLWLIDNKGCGVLDPKTQKLTRLQSPLGESPVLVYCDEQGRIWMATHPGSIYLVDPDSLMCRLIVSGSGQAVTTLYAEKDRLWVGSQTDGLKQYTPTGQLEKVYDFNSKIGHYLNNWQIRQVLRDHAGNLWISTYQGLFIETSQGALHWFTSENKTGIPHSSIFALFEDRQNGVWLGTWAGGVSYYHPAINQFVNHSHSNAPTSLSNNMVSSFVQAASGELLVGTERGGLNWFDKKNGTFSRVKLATEKTDYSIKHQCMDHQGGHWVGTQANGLWYKAAGQQSYQQFTQGKEDGRHLSSNSVYSLFPVDSGVWIGTHGGGLNFYHHHTRYISFQASLFPHRAPIHNPFIKSLLADAHDQLWIGTVSGLQCIALDRPAAKAVTEPFINSYIYCLTEIDSDELWAGTKTDGVLIYNQHTRSFSSFDANGLLTNKSVYGIQEDHNGHIWITCNDGLIVYKPEFQSSKRYATADGIQGQWFNPQAIFRDCDNLLYFGGTNGFTTVAPDQLKMNTRPPQVTIHRLSVNNDRVLQPFASNNDSHLQDIHLEPGENTLRFDFVSDNYLLPGKNRFQYRLVNHYNQWIEAPMDASAQFINLKWGTYLFEVKSCNNDDVWCLEPARVRLIIAKPFYATPLAFGLYLGAIGLLIYSGLRLFKTRSRLQNNIFRQQIQLKQEEELHELKLNFFTNVSHEFKTPLSLISGPVKTLTQAGNLTDNQHKMVDIIQRNASRLLMLINQIIDFRKMDQAHETLHLSKTNLVHFVQERARHFAYDATARSITFTQTYPHNSMDVVFDPEKVDYILFNLLSNAFKYNSSGKHITLSLTVGPYDYPANYENEITLGQLATDRFISICVQDEGQGIAGDELPKVFERYQQGSNQPVNSSGIGLSLCRDFTLLHRGVIHLASTVGKGSCVVVELPEVQTGEPLSPEAGYPQMAHSPAQAAFSGPSCRPTDRSDKLILIVEDHADLRSYITSILAPLYTIRTAENGKAALEILSTIAVDLIVSDVMMPEMDGFELCARVKGDLAISHIPLILLTALSSTENKISGMHQGADAYLSKPFDDHLLIARIDNLLEQREKLKAYFTTNHQLSYTLPAESREGYFLNKLNEAIETHLGDEDFDVERLTELIGLSRSQLHRKLKSLTNYSTTEYIRIYRLEKAIELLKTGQYNIDEVAHVVGFTTHSYFSRCFKRHYHETPKAYMIKLLAKPN